MLTPLIFSCLMLASTVQAASFDCAKAKTKVEKFICADAELSKLDEKLAEVYSKVSKDEQDAVLIKRQQLAWLKKRNQCEDVSCLRDQYLRRIAELNETESYTLLMSKDDELCSHMLALFNQDLEQYGESGDEHQEEHEEFRRVPWQPARFSSVINGHTEYTEVEGALFDFNNDGVVDFVVRWKASLSNARADLLIMFDSDAAKRKADMVSSQFWNAKNHIDLSGGWYNLDTPFDSIAGVRVLEPFIYRNTSYLVMRPLFEVPPITSGYVAITKYGGGKFINRELTGKMEDICYYRRNRANRTH
jgi:uncharacterized protein